MDPLPSGMAVTGLRGAAAPMAVRATQAVHVQQRAQVRVIKEKEKPDLGKEKSMGQFAPGALDRIKMRLEGQGTYAVISALVVNMGIRLLSGNSPEMLTQAWWPVSCAYSCALATCVLSGVYATVVFTLTKMYAMTVIGNYKDAQFAEFFRETQKYRAAGFKAFCASLGSFAFAFVTFFLLKFCCWGWHRPQGDAGLPWHLPPCRKDAQVMQLSLEHLQSHCFFLLAWATAGKNDQWRSTYKSCRAIPCVKCCCCAESCNKQLQQSPLTYPAITHFAEARESASSNTCVDSTAQPQWCSPVTSCHFCEISP